MIIQFYEDRFLNLDHVINMKFVDGDDKVLAEVIVFMANGSSIRYFKEAAYELYQKMKEVAAYFYQGE